MTGILTVMAARAFALFSVCPGVGIHAEAALLAIEPDRRRKRGGRCVTGVPPEPARRTGSGMR